MIFFIEIDDKIHQSLGSIGLGLFLLTASGRYFDVCIDSFT